MQKLQASETVKLLRVQMLYWMRNNNEAITLELYFCTYLYFNTFSIGLFTCVYVCVGKMNVASKGTAKNQ